jgi:serine/threonine protein kinase
MRKVIFNNVVCNEDDDFMFTKVVYEEGGELYTVNVDKMKVDPHEVTGKLIPKHSLYPKVSKFNTLTVFDGNSEEVFIKRTNPVHYDLDGGDVSMDMEREINVMEVLKLHSHSNIAEYLGSIVEGDLVTGICYRKYERTLTETLNTDRVLEGVKSGLDHLHSLGYIHDDINPRNIMLDKEGRGIIIDFDSCKKTGSRREGKCGTNGWTMDNDVASVENDHYSLHLLEKYLAQCIPGKHVDEQAIPPT